MGYDQRSAALQAGTILALAVLAVMFGCEPSPSPNATPSPPSASDLMPPRSVNHRQAVAAPHMPVTAATVDDALDSLEAQLRSRQRINGENWP
jgi:hypothetical protein